MADAERDDERALPLALAEAEHAAVAERYINILEDWLDEQLAARWPERCLSIKRCEH